MTRHLRGAPSGPCQACGKETARLQLDHIKPLWDGGANDTRNLQWLCATCHRIKTSAEQRSPAYRFRRSQDQRRAVPVQAERGCLGRVWSVTWRLAVMVLVILVVTALI